MSPTTAILIKMAIIYVATMPWFLGLYVIFNTTIFKTAVDINGVILICILTLLSTFLYSAYLKGVDRY